jgi:uncharacterized protein (DUF934 family)
MPTFDLALGDVVTLPPPDLDIASTEPLPASLAAAGIIAICFGVFSDGRGFTHARRLRTNHKFTGPLVATGHVIPDQIDYLRRCGFTHAVIKTSQLSHWQHARLSITCHFQHMLDSPRSRH